MISPATIEPNLNDSKAISKARNKATFETSSWDERVFLDYPSRFEHRGGRDSAGNEKETSATLILERRDIAPVHDEICIKRDFADFAFLLAASPPTTLLAFCPFAYLTYTIQPWPPFREPFARPLGYISPSFVRNATVRFNAEKYTRRKSSSGARDEGRFLIRKKKTRFVNGKRARECGYAVKMAWLERVFVERWRRTEVT